MSGYLEQGIKGIFFAPGRGLTARVSSNSLSSRVIKQLGALEGLATLIVGRRRLGSARQLNKVTVDTVVTDLKVRQAGAGFAGFQVNQLPCVFAQDCSSSSSLS